MLQDVRPTELLLPPVFRAVACASPHDVFATACDDALEAGAGTLVHAESDETLAVAVILEPDRALREARFAFFGGMAAVADALAAHCPPERAVTFAWPDGILYDLARLGGGRLAADPAASETGVPDWMVFGFELIRGRPGLRHTGLHPNSISLEEEEFEDMNALVESFARNLMRYFDLWSAQGVASLTKPYLDRLSAESDAQYLIDGHGDLLVRMNADVAPERRSLVAGLTAKRWYDPARKGPRL